MRKIIGSVLLAGALSGAIALSPSSAASAASGAPNGKGLQPGDDISCGELTIEVHSSGITAWAPDGSKWLVTGFQSADGSTSWTKATNGVPMGPATATCTADFGTLQLTELQRGPG